MITAKRLSQLRGSVCLQRLVWKDQVSGRWYEEWFEHEDAARLAYALRARHAAKTMTPVAMSGSHPRAIRMKSMARRAASDASVMPVMEYEIQSLIVETDC